MMWHYNEELGLSKCRAIAAIFEPPSIALIAEYNFELVQLPFLKVLYFLPLLHSFGQFFVTTLLLLTNFEKDQSLCLLESEVDLINSLSMAIEINKSYLLKDYTLLFSHHFYVVITLLLNEGIQWRLIICK